MNRSVARIPAVIGLVLALVAATPELVALKPATSCGGLIPYHDGYTSIEAEAAHLPGEKITAELRTWHR